MIVSHLSVVQGTKQLWISCSDLKGICMLHHSILHGDECPIKVSWNSIHQRCQPQNARIRNMRDGFQESPEFGPVEYFWRNCRVPEFWEIIVELQNSWQFHKIHNGWHPCIQTAAVYITKSRAITIDVTGLITCNLIRQNMKVNWNNFISLSLTVFKSMFVFPLNQLFKVKTISFIRLHIKVKTGGNTDWNRKMDNEQSIPSIIYTMSSLGNSSN